MPSVPGQGVVRDLDPEGVAQFATDLGDRPVPGEATMPDPTKDVPSDGPFGQRDGDLKFRTLRLGVTGAAGIGAVVELADQLDRTIESVDPTVPVVTDIHHTPAERAITVEDLQFPESEVRILGQAIRHPALLHAVA
jgi:hypothetical protein